MFPPAVGMMPAEERGRGQHKVSVIERSEELTRSNVLLLVSKRRGDVSSDRDTNDDILRGVGCVRLGRRCESTILTISRPAAMFARRGREPIAP